MKAKTDWFKPLRPMNFLTVLFKQIVLFVLITSSTVLAASVTAMPARFSAKKKVIEFGWAMPTTAYLSSSANVANLESRPFSGVVIQTDWPGINASVLNPTAVPASSFGIATLSAIKFNKFTDNFIYSRTVGSRADFYDDAAWKNVVANVGLLGQAIVAAKAKGLVLDVEDYGSHIWVYNSTSYPNLTFAQVSAQVRLRGKQFMQALVAQKADVAVLTTGLWTWSDCTTGDYALLCAWGDGLLEGAAAGSKVIDGNETSFYYPETVNWAYGNGTYNSLSNLMLSRTAADLKAKALSNAQLSEAVYLNPFIQNGVTNLKGVEHNIYQTLLNADEYVWFYYESPNQATWLSNAYPSDLAAAINSGVSKIANGQALGWTMYSTNPNDNWATLTVRPQTANLSITSPVQNQNFATTDQIVISLQGDASVSGINVYSISGNTNACAANPCTINAGILAAGTYQVYAVSNSFSIMSNPVIFTVGAGSVVTPAPSPSPSPTVLPSPSPTVSPVPTVPAGEFCSSVAENSSASVACPSGQVISKIVFASYGTPNGSCSAYVTSSSCNASNSMSIVQAACLGKSSCSVLGANSVFGDPCAGTLKSLAIDVQCAAPVSSAPVPTVDSTAPVTAITSPSNASYVARGSIVQVVASASDNVGVAKVEFYVNGTLKCSDSAASYTCNFSVANRSGKSYNIQTKAYDTSGNVGYSSILNIRTK